MKAKHLFTAFAASCLALAALPAVAQEMSYPEKCKGMDMAKMDTSSGGGTKMDMSSGDMKMDMPMDKMGDYQKAVMEGMKSMHDDMMQGMTQKDPDVAFVCGMIAHHMGAIAMSEAELKYGDNKAAKDMAKKVIAAQKKEIAYMTKWVEKEAK
ncbi:CopM family metallochaperone [Rhizobium sp. YTU87027]|uniref:CopM family metallochaperone n=1 Tax=Rhizobium sp. YTU87027 TaxID=3417741 RepID=UPI003D683374